MEKCCRAGQATDDNIIRRRRFGCCITKVTYTHSEYVILIAFPRQQWLRERASLLYYTYIVLLKYDFFSVAIFHEVLVYLTLLEVGQMTSLRISCLPKLFMHM
jgi:hypothetical protein